MKNMEHVKNVLGISWSTLETIWLVEISFQWLENWMAIISDCKLRKRYPSKAFITKTLKGNYGLKKVKHNLNMSIKKMCQLSKVKEASLLWELKKKVTRNSVTVYNVTSVPRRKR